MRHLITGKQKTLAPGPNLRRQRPTLRQSLTNPLRLQKVSITQCNVPMITCLMLKPAATTAVDPLANLPNGGQSIPQASMHNIPRDQANMSNFVTACQVDMLRTTTLLAAYPESQAKVDAVVQGDNEMAGKLYGIVLATGIDPCPELSALSGAPPGIEPPSGNASQ